MEPHTAPASSTSEAPASLTKGWHAFTSAAPPKPGRYFVRRRASPESSIEVDVRDYGPIVVNIPGAKVNAHAFIVPGSDGQADATVIDWRGIPDTWKA